MPSTVSTYRAGRQASGLGQGYFERASSKRCCSSIKRCCWSNASQAAHRKGLLTSSKNETDSLHYARSDDTKSTKAYKASAGATIVPRGAGGLKLPLAPHLLEKLQRKWVIVHRQ